MLKKAMLCLMILITAAKLLPLAFLLSVDASKLPLAVCLSVGLLILFGVLLIGKNLVKSITKKELSLYYLLMLASVTFNLLYMKFFSRVQVSTLELLVIGTVMDILIAGTVLLLTIHESKYVRVRVHSEQP